MRVDRFLRRVVAIGAFSALLAPTFAAAAVPDVDVHLQDIPTVTVNGLAHHAVSINGTSYTRGLRSDTMKKAGATKSHEYDLGRRCTSMEAVVGLTDDSDVNGSMVWEVYLEGQRVAQFPVTFGAGRRSISLDLRNVLRLKLVAVTAKDTTNNSRAAMGDPVLRCRSSAHVARLAGPDRLGTATAISADSHPDADSAQAVVLVRSDSFADALAGAPLAEAKRGPLLLTGRDALDAGTRQEIDRVLPQGGTVYLLGGTEALAPAVEDSLRGAGYSTVRYAGQNRYDTAVRVAENALESTGTVFVANGLDFYDALAAGASSDVAGGAAIVLTNGSTLPPETARYLSRHQSARVFAIGDPAVAAVPSAIAVPGSDPVAVAVAIAKQFHRSPTVVGVAGTRTFGDALTGGAHVGAQAGPLLWTKPDQVSKVVADYLKANRAAIDVAYLYGGPAAINESVDSAIRAGI